MTTPFWLAPRPLILASGSAARRGILEAAGLPFQAIPAAVDERAVEQPLRDAGAAPGKIALHLAAAKAQAVSHAHPGDLVLGADQVLALGARLFAKPVDRDDARRTLLALSGRTHSLHAGWSLMRDGKVLHGGVDEARLTMRSFSDAFLQRYLDAEGDALCTSVGAYRLEGLGVHLFESVAGAHTTILGLPLLPVLAALREVGALLG